MNDKLTLYRSAFERITQDPRYRANLDWGKPRSGHPEGTVRAHIEELEGNLARLAPRLSEEEHWKLKLLIHTHDSFKAEALSGVAITHPQSHASLARAFLAEFVDDSDLAAMVQFHDEPFALWRQFDQKGSCSSARWAALRESIQDWDLFLAFCLIDGCTEGKGRGTLVWLFGMVEDEQKQRFSERNIV